MASADLCAQDLEAALDGDIAALAQGLQAQLLGGATLGEMKGLSEDGMEALYSHGYGLYNQGRFHDALMAFAFLLMHNQYERRYYNGFAACLQMSQRPEEALKYYGMASMLQLSDPLPVFHSAQCQLALGRTAQALEALELVQQLAAGQPGHVELGQRAAAMRQLLTQAPPPHTVQGH